MTSLEFCPLCKHKSMYFRSSFNTWRCNYCYKEFSPDKTQLRGDMIDEYGNEYRIKVERNKDEIIQTKIFFLEKGKITLKSEHPKLKDEKDCPFPERLSCNYGIGFERCPYMKYENNIWLCEYKNESKDFKKEPKTIENIPI